MFASTGIRRSNCADDLLIIQTTRTRSAGFNQDKVEGLLFLLGKTQTLSRGGGRGKRRQQPKTLPEKDKMQTLNALAAI